MTPTRLPESKLAEIAEREWEATPGPWEASRAGTVWGPNSNSIPVANDATDADADFIATARTDIPALLEHVRALEAELAAYRAPCKRCGSYALHCGGCGYDGGSDE